MRGCDLLSWDRDKNSVCNAVDTTYRIATADGAPLLFGSHQQFRNLGTDSSTQGDETALEKAICQETEVSSSDDQHASQTDLAVVIVPGTGDVTICMFLLVPDFMVRRTPVMDTWFPTPCCFMIHMCSYVQVRRHRQPHDCINQLVQLVKKFPEGFFMQTAAFFNAALRSAFAASAPAVAYARQLLHVRYNEDRDSCEIDGGLL
jgi:hypothetical protein